MRGYYKAPVKKVYATNFKIKDNKVKYDRYDEVVENDVTFYFNHFDVLIRNNTKEPIIREEEIHDIIVNSVQSNMEDKIEKIEIEYVNPLELRKVEHIQVERPKQRIKIFSREKTNR